MIELIKQRTYPAFELSMLKDRVLQGDVSVAKEDYLPGVFEFYLTNQNNSSVTEDSLLNEFNVVITVRGQEELFDGGEEFLGDHKPAFLLELTEAIYETDNDSLTAIEAIQQLAEIGFVYNVEKCAFKELTENFKVTTFTEFDLLPTHVADVTKSFEENILDIIKDNTDDLSRAAKMIEKFSDAVADLDDHNFDVMEVHDFIHQQKRVIWSMEKVLNPDDPEFEKNNGVGSRQETLDKISALSVSQEFLDDLTKAYQAKNNNIVMAQIIMKNEFKSPDTKYSGIESLGDADVVRTIISKLLLENGGFDLEGRNWVKSDVLTVSSVVEAADNKEEEEDTRPDLEVITVADILAVFK